MALPYSISFRSMTELRVVLEDYFYRALDIAYIVLLCKRIKALKWLICECLCFKGIKWMPLYCIDRKSLDVNKESFTIRSYTTQLE